MTFERMYEILQNSFVRILTRKKLTRVVIASPKQFKTYKM
jgi:hypothetical protein